MDLIATPKNPIPLGAATGFLDIKKSVRVRYARWPSALKERRGTVCIFPGRSEFIEKYFEVVGELRRRGFAVAIMDWRGQGGSSRLAGNPLKGHVRDFSDYESDLSRFMTDVVLPDCPPPFFALGHSMAATILLEAATKKGCWFSRMVLCCADAEDRGLADAGLGLRQADRNHLIFRLREHHGAGRHEGISRQPDFRGQSADVGPRALLAQSIGGRGGAEARRGSAHDRLGACGA